MFVISFSISISISLFLLFFTENLIVPEKLNKNVEIKYIKPKIYSGWLRSMNPVVTLQGATVRIHRIFNDNTENIKFQKENYKNMGEIKESDKLIKIQEEKIKKNIVPKFMFGSEKVETFLG